MRLTSVFACGVMLAGFVAPLPRTACAQTPTGRYTVPTENITGTVREFWRLTDEVIKQRGNEMQQMNKVSSWLKKESAELTQTNNIINEAKQVYRREKTSWRCPNGLTIESCRGCRATLIKRAELSELNDRINRAVRAYNVKRDVYNRRNNDYSAWLAEFNRKGSQLDDDINSFNASLRTKTGSAPFSMKDYEDRARRLYSSPSNNRSILTFDDTIPKNTNGW